MSGGSKIPNGWVETTLGEAIEVVGGGTPRTTISEYWDGDIPWLSVVDFNNDNRWVYNTEKSITEIGLQNSSTKLLNKGDVIISARGTVGAMAQLKKDMAFNQSCYGIKGIEDVSCIDFLFYLLKYSLKQINRNTYGAVFDTITTKTFDVINIKLPPLSEQKAIASILTSFDDKIELLQAQNETLETIAQTIFKEWFGKYQVGDELPEGWRVGKLGGIDFISFGDGNYSSKYPKQSAFIEKGVPFISNKDIKNGIIQNNDLRYISPELHSTLKKGHLKKWDIIMSTRANIGDMALVSDTFSGANINAQLVFIRASNKELYTPYLFELFSSKRYRRILENYSSGSAQSQLPMHALKEVEVIIPNEEALKVFSDLWIKLINKKEINQEQIQTLQQTRDTLLPKLMSGKLRVDEFKD